jgi:dihydrofolate synthase/folylpolyglutamate synthase
MGFDFIDAKLGRFGSRPGLERISRIMAEFGDPQERMRIVIVTGTNGKGSVTSFIASILTAAGHKTGSYFSPHLVDYRERFMIDGKKIAMSKLEKYERGLESLFDKGVEMTTFEALTAMAYRCFAEEKVDFAIMEVGMGGEFDATAVAKPEVGVITNIALEHTEYLGDTIEKIARTKAGILKNGSRCVTGCSGEALGAVEEVATAHQAASVVALGRDFFVEPKEISRKGTVFDYIGKTPYTGLRTRLLGRHQVDNAALAVAAVEELNPELGEKAIRKGLLAAQNPGRLQVISEKPLVLVDAAHNPAGMGSLVSSLSLFDFERLIVVFGVLGRKDWKAMLALLGLHADVIIVNKQKHEGAADPDEVRKEASRYAEAIKVEDVKQSLGYAKSIAGPKDMVVVCGSIYMLGELLG